MQRKSYPNAHFAKMAAILDEGRSKHHAKRSRTPVFVGVKGRDGHPVALQGINPAQEQLNLHKRVSQLAVPAERVLASSRRSEKVRGWDAVIAGFDPYTAKIQMAGRRYGDGGQVKHG